MGHVQVQEMAAQLRTARSQLALKLSLVAEKNALIAALLQQTGQVCLASHAFCLCEGRLGWLFKPQQSCGKVQAGEC